MRRFERRTRPDEEGESEVLTESTESADHLATAPQESPDGHRDRGAGDLLGWLALAWAGAFGLLYAEMIVQSRAPGLLAAVRRAMSEGSGDPTQVPRPVGNQGHSHGEAAPR